MKQKKTVINEIDMPATEVNDTQPVLAYRVRQLEGAVTHGFEKLNEKFDALTSQFTPITDHEELKKRVQAIEQTKSFWRTVKDVTLTGSTITILFGLYEIFKK